MRRFISAPLVVAFLVAVVPIAGQPAPPFRPAVRAGNLLYLSGALPTGSDGKIVAGDIKAQTRQAMDNLKTVLQANGAALERVASVSVYLKRASDFAAMNEVYRSYWASDPPARTTVIANLVVPDALVEISMVALASAADRVVVHPAAWVKSPSPYSYAVRSGDTLFLSGLVPRNGRDNTPVAGDIAVQTHAVLRNAGEILRAAGMDYADVVSARVFLTDVADFEVMNAVYRTYFPKDPPARATVRAGLTAPDYLVEIALTAVSGRDRQIVTTPGADGSPGRPNPNLSSAVRVGNRLFLSGMLGNTPENGGDLRAQTREALARIGRTLQSAGFGWNQVAESTVYLTDARRADEMNKAYREGPELKLGAYGRTGGAGGRLVGDDGRMLGAYGRMGGADGRLVGVDGRMLGAYGREFPARATVETGLVSPGALVEIMMNASR